MTKKLPFRGPFDNQHGQCAQNTVEICITAPLSYSLGTGEKIVLEIVSLIDMQNLGAACQNIACR